MSRISQRRLQSEILMSGGKVANSPTSATHFVALSVPRWCCDRERQRALPSGPDELRTYLLLPALTFGARGCGSAVFGHWLHGEGVLQASRRTEALRTQTTTIEVALCAVGFKGKVRCQSAPRPPDMARALLKARDGTCSYCRSPWQDDLLRTSS